MDKNGNKVSFDGQEQHRFGVDPVVSVDSALETARTLGAVAGGLMDKANNLIGDTTTDGRSKRADLLHRATELNTFSAAILSACGEKSPVDQFLDTFDN